MFSLCTCVVSRCAAGCSETRSALPTKPWKDSPGTISPKLQKLVICVQHCAARSVSGLEIASPRIPMAV